MLLTMIKIRFNWLRTCIEIPTLLVFLSFIIAQTVIYNFIMYRSCYVDFNYNKSDCERLGTGEEDDYLVEIESKVQSQVSVNLMVQEILNQVAPAFLCLLLGPWSDVHGRRPVLNSSLFGLSFGFALALIVVFVDSLSAWWFTVMSLVAAAFGGINTFSTAVICYVSDITDEKNRGMRMSIFEGVIIGGMVLGTLSTSYIFKATGYGTIFVLLVASVTLGFLYHFFFIVESLQNKDKNKVGLFSLRNIKEMFYVTFKFRENHGRIVLILCIILSVLVKFITQADGPIYYLFLRLKLNWDMEKFTLFKAFSSLLLIVMTVGGSVLFQKVLKVREMPLIIVSGILAIISRIIQAVAEDDWHIYLSGVIMAFAGLLSPMVRSFLTKLVNPDETGKVFALSSFIESLVLLFGIMGYTALYGNTKDTNPGVFNYITAGLYALVAIIAIWILIIQKYYQKDDIVVANNKMEEIDR